MFVFQCYPKVTLLANKNHWFKSNLACSPLSQRFLFKIFIKLNNHVFLLISSALGPVYALFLLVFFF